MGEFFYDDEKISVHSAVLCGMAFAPLGYLHPVLDSGRYVHLHGDSLPDKTGTGTVAARVLHYPSFSAAA